MRVKFTKKRYYDKILRQPGDIVDVDDRTGRAYVNAHAADIVKMTKKSRDFYKAGRTRSFISMPTMQEVSENLKPKSEETVELDELSDDIPVEKKPKPTKILRKTTSTSNPKIKDDDTEEDADTDKE